ncbi:hypothetical protein CP532_6006 [Ophiocordyceps camponoti-leonardi (nom. inval.)]|nr:hypothetical protein CP532_6006 [Ophiocordyceps camponoti-leonardi (nom. inval.)]
MVALQDAGGNLLQSPSNDPPPPPAVRSNSAYAPLPSFALDKQRSYRQQYGDMYFLRLTKLRPFVDEAAAEAWRGTVVGGEEARRVDRVLDVRQGELCWVSGTVYMDMPLKPNILDDVSKDRWISAPVSTQRYYTDEETDQMMLEDDSGRVRLVGEMARSVPLVTGCIVAVMGTENSSGEFEVLDIKFPDLAPQPSRWTLTKKGKEGEGGDSSSKLIALVSGLEFSSVDASHSLELSLLREFLLGESLSSSAQDEAARISRLIIAGNSVSDKSTEAEQADKSNGSKKSSTGKKYGYDASAYNPLPSQLLDDFLAEILPSMPVTLMPGARDPANASYPQQPLHLAMFPRARSFGPDNVSSSSHGWLDNVTNPFEAEVAGWRLLATSGQNVDDVFKYTESNDRLGMMEAMCRWRCCAPTAPDTLWSYPFQEEDPFVMKACPHIYLAGCQPDFSTKLVHGPQGQTVRLVTLPSFAETKELALLDTETLEVTRVKIDVDLSR